MQNKSNQDFRNSWNKKSTSRLSNLFYLTSPHEEFFLQNKSMKENLHRFTYIIKILRDGYSSSRWMFEMGVPTATFPSMNVQQQQTCKQINNNLTTIKKNKNSKISKNQNKKPTHPSYKKILTPTTNTLNPNPWTWTQEPKGETWTQFFHPKIILYNTSIVETNLCFSKKKMFFKRKLNSVLFFIFKIKTSLQKIKKKSSWKNCFILTTSLSKFYDEFLQVFFITEEINVHVYFE